MQILIIEDHVELATQLGNFLGSLDWDFDYSTTGKKGINLALTNEYDLIILDLNLPDIDGIHVCKEIKDKSKCNIPILMLTARDSYADKIKGFDFGADLILSERNSARNIMGSLFDISEFHDVILEPGVRALPQVREDIRSWVQLASARGE